MKDNQKVFLSFLIGATAGVAAGILLAPYSGRESRQKLADTAGSLGNDLSGQFNTSLDKLNELKNSVVSTINDLTGKVTDKAKQAADYGTAKAKEAADRAGNQA